MTAKYFTTIFTIYVLIAIFTFGHSYTDTCIYDNQPCTSAMKGTGAAISAMWWPFYWSIELQNEET